MQLLMVESSVWFVVVVLFRPPRFFLFLGNVPTQPFILTAPLLYIPRDFLGTSEYGLQPFSEEAIFFSC